MSCQFHFESALRTREGVLTRIIANGSVIKMLAGTGEFESQTDHSHEGGPDGVEAIAR